VSNKVYGIVTDNIIALLDQGVVPWRQPWQSKGGSIPRNAWDRPYRGINVFILETTRLLRGYKSNVWMTYKQAESRGGKVRKGEKSTLVIFWKTLRVEDATTRSGEKVIPLLRYFNVFNLDQTDGVKLTRRQQADAEEPEAEAFEPYADAEAIIGTYLASDNAPSYNEGGSAAYYIPDADAITVPARSDFASRDGFYATTFHEFSHSTGHPSRLAREGVTGRSRFGCDSYAAEELVAEMGAAFLSAVAGIDNTIENSAAYIAGWRSRFASDPTLIVKVAGKAQKAADLILGTTFEQEEDE
jgi:antirestriction protein ArdC